MKEYKTIEQQVEILKKRGLIVTDENKLRKYLLSYNYYRLSGYSLKYRDKDNFKSYIRDEHIYQAFNIDAQMRLLLLELCFTVESKLKTRLAYTLGENDALAYLNNNIYNSKNTYDPIENCFKKDLVFADALEYIKKNNANIYEHHKEKYEGKYPIWVIIDFLSFGDAVRLYELLNDTFMNEVSNKFNSKYLIPKREFGIYIEAIQCLRNACAHSDRLINKGLSKKIPKFCFDNKTFKYIRNTGGLYDKISSNIYGYFIAISQLLSDEKELMKKAYVELTKIFKENYLIKPEDYGFIGDWDINILMPKDISSIIKEIKHEYKEL